MLGSIGQGQVGQSDRNLGWRSSSCALGMEPTALSSHFNGQVPLTSPFVERCASIVWRFVNAIFSKLYSICAQQLLNTSQTIWGEQWAWWPAPCHCHFLSLNRKFYCSIYGFQVSIALAWPTWECVLGPGIIGIIQSILPLYDFIALSLAISRIIIIEPVFVQFANTPHCPR